MVNMNSFGFALPPYLIVNRSYDTEAKINESHVLCVHKLNLSGSALESLDQIIWITKDNIFKLKGGGFFMLCL